MKNEAFNPDFNDQLWNENLEENDEFVPHIVQSSDDDEYTPILKNKQNSLIKSFTSKNQNENDILNEEQKNFKFAFTSDFDNKNSDKSSNVNDNPNFVKKNDLKEEEEIPFVGAEKTIDEFNHFPLGKQHFAISQAISIANNYITQNSLSKILKLFLYLIPYMHQKNRFIKIKAANKQTLLKDIDDNICIQLLSDATKTLFELNLEETSHFQSILKSFNCFSFEIQFPSDSFQYIYERIMTMKHNKKYPMNNTLICVFVTGIDSICQQFYNTKFIDYMVIDSSVTQIMNFHLKGSFENCSSLKFIDIPSSVTSIDCFSFKNCSSLNKINISSSIKTIGESTFEGCSSLTQIEIPSSVTEIGLNAFKGCSSLKTIIIPSSVVKFGASVFSGCSSLTNIKISSTVTKLENSFFNGCSSLTNIEIPSSVNEICFWTFRGCSSLKKVTIPLSVTKISDSAFDGCLSLIEIIIPPSVTYIGSNVFNDCKSLVSISIPSSVTKLGSFVFNGCSSLKQITIPSSLNEIPDWTFNECSSLDNLSIPSSIETIGKGAFYKCVSLKEISIPCSITEIKGQTFELCSSLKKNCDSIFHRFNRCGCF